MRAEYACVATILLGACSSQSPEIETIEIHRSGGVSYNIIIHSDGTGEFEGSRLLPEKRKRRFVLKAGQFAQFAAAIRPYFRNARPVTNASLRDVVYGNWPKCPNPRHYTYDAGALYLRWQGPKTNVHYLIDFGCDYEANRTRDQRLMQAVHQLPIRSYLGVFG